ncbi:nucleotidyltransferase domain-containing protein [Candidatus Pacearchaeota archaeon]|nr:nucleotidyltransferase domain-containing protein [Candidatus Pacearchaeota archaeon]
MVKYKNTKKGEKEKIKLKPKEKLIKYLIENKGPVSMKQASEAIAVDYKNVYGYVGDLTASGAIVQKIVGNTSPIEINPTPNQEIYNVENKRTQKFLERNPKFRLIKEDINQVNYPFMIVLIFGSYVKNTKTEGSDIDICIILDNERKTKQLIETLNLLSLKLEIHAFTTNEFISMIEKTQNNLGREIVKSNIILYGIENYYNLISKWMKKE